MEEAEKRNRRDPSRASRDMSTRYRVFRRVMIFLGRLLFGFTVIGAEKVPEKGPLVVASNHRRYADPVLVCMAVPRRLQWMGKKELFVFPFERFFYFIGTFPVDREKGGRAALKTSLNFLAAGWALGIFPEGTRRKSYDPDHAPKSGVGMLAARAAAPILPVFVGKVPGPLQRLRGDKLRVYIGDPIKTNNTTRGGRVYREAAGKVLREIYALGGEKVGGGASS
ncbi:MAG: 1-acyl-sn-glycerol-3-phosphate acyltransferase [Actinomycetota bacterium]|nr:1-acyl-sn-glycerol-3-phosphate acyltransferase [Actinomycetota bacterium]